MNDYVITTASLDAATMVERLTAEGLLSLREAGSIFGGGRGGKGRHPATLTRDILKGTRLPDGRVVRLEALRVGNSFKTSRPAVLRYLAAQQASVGDTGAVEPSTPAARRREQVGASAELDAALGVSEKE